MRKFPLLLAGVLWLSACWGTPSPAEAVPGGTLEAAVKMARAQKRDVMGVTYYVNKGNRIVGESWSSEMSGWTEAMADRLRNLIVGKKPLKSKKADAVSIQFLYKDGTKVQYNMRRGKIITMDVAAPSFSPAELEAGKYRQVDDWKQKPWKGKAW